MISDPSPEAAGHVAAALLAHRKWAVRNHVAVPAEVWEMQQVFALRARRGQSGTPLEDLWRVRESEVMTPRLVTYAEAAKLLACSDRTIKRLVQAGELAPVRLGGTPRLRVSDIDSYVDAMPRAKESA